ncbi:hypothetical protein SAMN04488058_101314 [Deinococcus reticulitermitis]|uniref:Uncharacterized protein n=1 Tax=Deinococcus reticulitermitis TaxID=856736 RepID=A0A1H6SI71_9DEIO|nr:hypothetical protein [Deinococcus reticulitermitis]SEI67648.1 hypothetical protein SAMN04488058_101314 [Deinococcus reticulitermitis]
MLRFVLERAEDVSGNSGTGAVAEGVIFGDGRVAMRWRRPPRTTQLYECIDDVTQLHGHEGRSRVVLLDSLDDASPS